MATRLLIIDGNAQGPFSVSLAAGTLVVSGNNSDASVVLRDLHVSRIRCEVEVDSDFVVVSRPSAGAALGSTPFRKDLHLGETLDVGATRLRLGAGIPAASATATQLKDTTTLATDSARPEQSTAPAPGIPASPAVGRFVQKRIYVVDGADQGHVFPLPRSGTVTIGKSHKHALIDLNDLYVSRSHCDLEIDGDSVYLTNVRSQTLVNGQPVTDRRALELGDIIRVGNTQLRLELAGDSSSRGAGTRPDRDADDETVEPAEDWELVEEQPGDTTANLPHAPVDELLKLEEQTLGHYLIGSLLGRGQSSLVFRAQDLKKNQTVALKVLSPDFPADDAELQRFVQALRTVTQLQHPHLVALYGAGRAGAYCWIAREFIDGESVARLITRVKETGQFDWMRACRVGIHIGRALDFIHAHGVCHGNLSPRNILVSRARKVTKLSDLMLARALEGSQLQKAIVRKKLLLERAYMPPEQIDPYAPVKPAMDLYALGAVLYSLLTGQPPFDGNSPREILDKIQEGKVVKPRKMQPEIPVHFEAAVLKMMARDPEERFPNAAEMLATIEPIATLHEISI